MLACQQDSRLVWSAVDGPLGLTHHNASAQVFADGGERTRFVWIADVLPDDLAPAVRGLMEQGATAIKTTLEAETARGS